MTSRLHEKPFLIRTSVQDAILLRTTEERDATSIYAVAQLHQEAGDALRAWNDQVNELMRRAARRPRS